ncbi:MAG TPA: 50S ribosomal protein L9 [Gemmataceae bacterium]|jgi:large subunit ribosomal protein L9|nr:50S ribosomal protein L9 [Gemmataceae bacterium]
MPTRKQQLLKGNHGNVKLVLIEDVPHLGQQGQLVEVKPGYARNYLLPNSLATIPTEHNLRRLEKYKERVQKAREAKIADLKVLAEQIQRINVTIEANATEEGHLYGSVGPEEISKVLKSRNLGVEPAMVRIEGVMKECGVYENIPIHLGYEIDTKVTVTVVKQTEKK